MKEIILLQVNGQDRPGVTAAITRVLAQYDVDILDIGQAVIHDALSLGMLIAIEAENRGAPVLKDILFEAHKLGMRIRFQPVEQPNYDEWVAAQGKPRFIVTLLARKITARHISLISEAMAAQRLNIDAVNRLSGRVHVDADVSSDRACVEFSVRGEPADEAKLREQILEITSQYEVDIAFQQDNAWRRNRRLVAFDMDSTLINAEVIDELAKEAGVGAEVAEITEQAMRGELDFDESFRRRVALLKGLDVAVLEKIMQRIPLNEGAEHLVSTLRALGYKTAILSGGFTWFGKQLQQRLGIDYVYANELEVADGKVTGEVNGPIVNGQRKAELLSQLAEKEGLSLQQVIAVGDGANDLPMLKLAGLGIAFRAKPLVKQSAKQAISTLGLDGILYLLGVRDRDRFEVLQK